MRVSEPWIVGGQTQFTRRGRIINPEPSITGAMGEIDILPYTVPEGKILRIKNYVIEGYDLPGIVVLFMFTGNPKTDLEINSRSTVSCGAHGGSSQLFVNYRWPEKTLVNVVLLNGTKGEYVHGWYVEGELLDMP